MEVHLLLQDKEDERDEELYFSPCFQEFKSFKYYAHVTKKILAFSESFDKGTLESRLIIWKILEGLLGTKIATDQNRHFTAYVTRVFTQDTILQLFNIEA